MEPSGARPAELLCAELALPFTHLDVLRSALTHTSYRNEHREENIPDNERLEFLGDAVLELAISQYLYLRYPSALEGELTRMRAAIVCEPTLAEYARTLALSKYLRLGRGEEQSGGRDRASLLADAVEALVGALYLDLGLQAVNNFLQASFYPYLEEKAALQQDYKTMLQEQVQRVSSGELQYETLQERGPAHAREFVVRVRIAGESAGTGVGRSKKEAEQLAAKQALHNLDTEPN